MSIATPTFSPPAGSYAAPISVAISCATPGVVIYYAFNATPTTSSTEYTAPVPVNVSATLEAIAVLWPPNAPTGLKIS